MIARANKKINNKEIIGIPLLNLKRFNNKSFIITSYTRMQDLTNAVEIDSETLEYSFDDGESWFSDKDINLALDLLCTMRGL